MKQKNWFKPKAFTHLTNKLSYEDSCWINNYVSNPSAIASHKFYPLLHKTITVKRFKLSKDRTGKEVKRHYTIENGKRKSNIKYREIYFPNHLDAHIYSYYTQKILEPVYEAELIKNQKLNESILAYRKIHLNDESRCKCNIDFANDVFEEIKSSKGEIAVLALDISKFFDSLDHKKLKQTWKNLLCVTDLSKDHYNIYKSLTNFSYIELNDLLVEFKYKHPNALIQKNISCFINDGKEFRERIKNKGYIKKNPFRRKAENESIKIGIPQGTPISAFLANLYLLDFDKRILSFLENFKSIYRRYSDDILIICPKQFHIEIEHWIYSLIKEFTLSIQRSKTQKSFFNNGKLEKFQNL